MFSDTDIQLMEFPTHLPSEGGFYKFIDFLNYSLP
jgi:hypothetical protein